MCMDLTDIVGYIYIYTYGSIIILLTGQSIFAADRGGVVSVYERPTDCVGVRYSLCGWFVFVDVGLTLSLVMVFNVPLCSDIIET